MKKWEMAVSITIKSIVAILFAIALIRLMLM